MSTEKRTKTPLKLKTTILEVDNEISKINIPKAGLVDGVNERPSSSVRRHRVHWPRWGACDRLRPASASASTSSPKYVAYMSKSGKINADLKRVIRPVTAQANLRRPGSKWNDAHYIEGGRRISQSAGAMRIKSRSETVCAETKPLKPDSDSERQLTKESWPTADRLKNNERLFDVGDSTNIDNSRRNNITVSQNEKQLQDDHDNRINKTEMKTDIVRETAESKLFTVHSQPFKETNSNSFHNQMARKIAGLAWNTFEYDKFSFRNNYRKRLKSGKLSPRKDQSKIVSLNETSSEDDLAEKRSKILERISGLFRKAAMFVCSILHLQMRMTDLSSELTSRSATEEQWHAVNTSKHVKELVFNKDIFAKSKAVSRVPTWARAILEVPPDDRSELDLRKIHALLRGLRSFDKFTEKIQMAMCRAFTYQWATSGRIILRQGHVGVNFYFIYSGSVFVNINDTDKLGNQFVTTEVVLKRGDSFGELALLKDIRRTATISCREDCELLVVDKDTFAKVCPMIFEQELEEKCDFLGTLSMFTPKYWTRESLKAMCFEARIQEHKTNKIIVPNSSSDDWIYICMEGKASVIRKLDLEKEIEWRKRRRRLINEIKSSLPEVDVIDMLGVLEARAYSAGVQPTVKSTIPGREIGKDRLLTSMGLEYTHLKRLSIDDIQKCLDLRERSSISKKISSALNEPGSREGGPSTLTALISGEKKPNMLFLNIKTLHENVIFDIQSLFGDQSPGYILASEGCRVLKIRKKSFMEEASEKAILHAKALAELEKYLDDEQLLRNYMEHLTWITYRYSLFDRILRRKDRNTEQSFVRRKPRNSEALKVSAKENARNLEILTALNQAFYEYDPEMRRVAQWKQIQEMAAKHPTEEIADFTVILSEIRKHGSLIPEIQVNIRENIFKPKEIKIAKELVTSCGLIHGGKEVEHRLGSIDEDDI